MKTTLGLALLLTPLLSPAQESPALSFPNSKIESGPLSLLDAAKQALPPVFGNVPVPMLQGRPRTRIPRPVLSKMPIVIPNDNVEYHIQVVKPNESIDYKLTVKDVEVESSK
ncbi:MAG: hypothetical protein ABIV50_13795 [Opitutus sp.]